MKIIEKNGKEFVVHNDGRVEGVARYGKHKQTGEDAVVTDSGAAYRMADMEYQPGFGDYAQQVLGQGLAMGFGDEISAAARAGWDTLTEGKPFLSGYEAARDKVRRDMKATEQSLGPAATFGLQAAGGLMTGLAGFGRQAVKQGLSLGSKAARGALQGLGQGAVTGAGMAEGDLASHAKGAGYGAAGGLALGGLFPVGTHYAGQGLSALGRQFPGGARRQAQDVVAAQVPRSDVPRIRSQVEGDPLSVVSDYLPEDAARVASNSLRNIGSGKQRGFLEGRHRTQEPRLSRIVSDQISGQRIDDAIAGLSGERQRLAKQNYGSIYDQALPETGELTDVLSNPAIKRHWNDIGELAEIEGVVLPDEWDDVRLVPTVGVVDAIKRGLDDVVSELYRSGKGTRATAIKNVRDRMKAEVDRLVPEYKDARSTYAGLSAAMEAAENGRKFMLSIGDEGKALKGVSRSDIADLGEHEYEAFLAGAASAIRDKMERKGFGADVTKIFETPGFNKDLNALLGRERAAQFRRALAKEQRYSKTYSQTQGSPTSERENIQGSMLRNVLSGDMTGMAIDSILNKVAPQPEAVSKEMAGMFLSPKAADKAAALAALEGRGVVGPTLQKARGLLDASAMGVGGYSGGLLGNQFTGY